MRKFIIKSAQHPPKSGDIFGFNEAEEHIYCYAAGVQDLRDIIRFITPTGYGVRSPRWFALYTSKLDVLVIKNPLLGTVMHEIIEINFTPEIEKEIEFRNQPCRVRILKIIKSELWTSQAD